MMTLPNIVLGSLVIFMGCIVVLFDFKYNALKDGQSGQFSFSKVQMSWWTILIFASFATVTFVTKHVPNLDPSLLGLIGLSGGTTLFSSMIDARDKTIATIQSNGFLSDILNKGDIHRLQALLSNLIVGLWFLLQVFENISVPLTDKFTVDMIMPSIPNYVLLLLCVSSALYLGLKTQEK